MRFQLKFPIVIIFVLFANAIQAQEPYTQMGYASYYADAFQGRYTSSGEKYNNKLYTAAHATLPFHTLVKVTNLKTGKYVIVKINDRCPKYYNRIIDLSKAAAKKIDILASGIAQCKLEVITLSNLNALFQAPDSMYTEMPAPESAIKEFISRRSYCITTIDKVVFNNFISAAKLINSYQARWQWHKEFYNRSSKIFLSFQRRQVAIFYSL